MRESEALSDFTLKKSARQLDFTAIHRASANAALSHHSKLQSPQPKQSQEVLQCRFLSQPGRIPHPVQKEKVPLYIVQQAKEESPGSQARNNAEGKDGTPKKGKQCKCKNSRCLKLYCECFAAGIHCNGCNCLNCYNNVENEAARQEAMVLTLERNPNAFRPKIATSPQGCLDAREHSQEAQIISKHNKGCHCKKSSCLKKYCECFQANILCSENCKCMDCKNSEGSEERRSFFLGKHNSIEHMQQAANSAINGAIGSSGYGTSLMTRKRKSKEHPRNVTRGQVVHSTRKHKQEIYQKSSAASLSLPSGQIHVAANATVLGSSKLNYKSPLAGILKSQHVNEICSLFVLLSHEAMKELSGERRNYHKFNTTPAMYIQEREHDRKGQDVHKTSTDDYLNGNKTSLRTNSDSETDDGNSENERSAHLEIDLMCHEKEMEFTEATAENGLTEYCKNKPMMTFSGNENSDVYAEQEKLILTRFRDFLNRLVTCGDAKGHCPCFEIRKV